MNTLDFFTRAGAASALLVSACALPPSPPSIPAVLAPPPGETPLVVLPAHGVQIYECRAGADGPAWAFVAPEAELFDREGRHAGHHGAGPSWQADDGSAVVGTVRQRADAPQAGAVPWLLLQTRAQGPQGRFSGVTSIQRLHTAGGAAPTRSCRGDRLGEQARMPYRADYVLFTRR